MTSPGKEAGVLEWVCDLISESMGFVSFTKNFCRSQNKFADIRNKITGASCLKLSRYCAVIIAEENGIAYICRTQA